MHLDGRSPPGLRPSAGSRMRHVPRRRSRLLVYMPPSLQAQAGHEHTGPAPERLGHVDFPIGLRAAPVAGRFERARRAAAFLLVRRGRAAPSSEVAAADSSCALAYWGQAMSVLHPLWTPPSAGGQRGRALADAERAVRAQPAGHARARDYAEAIATYYRGRTAVDHGVRLLAYEQRHGRPSPSAVRRDEEAQDLLRPGADRPRPARRAATRRSRASARPAEILEPLFRRHPRPSRARPLSDSRLRLAGARARGRVGGGPLRAHRARRCRTPQHMPSHIYIRIGRVGRRRSPPTSRSAEAARQFETDQGMPGRCGTSDAHALDYLAYAYLQARTRRRRAGPWRSRWPAVTETFPAGSLTADYALAAIPARLRAGAGRLGGGGDPHGPPGTRLARRRRRITRFARALGAARVGHAAAARAEVDSSREHRARRSPSAGGPQTYWSTQVRIQRHRGRRRGWRWRRAIRSKRSRRRPRRRRPGRRASRSIPSRPGAVLPARELYGDLLRSAGPPRRGPCRPTRPALARQPGRARCLAATGAGGQSSRSGGSGCAEAGRASVAALLGPDSCSTPGL